jgi:DNA transformation protein
MFGGAGLYCEEFFFALISGDTLYMRVDDSNRADYSSRGMAQFRPYADRPHLSMSYYEIPVDVLENAGELITWAKRSVEVAMRAPKSVVKAVGRRTRGRKR